MNKHSQQIKDIIEYLVKVYNNEHVGKKSQNFFKSIPKLDILLNNYFLQFENNDEENKALVHKLEALNKLSFNENKEGYTIYKEDIDPSEDSPVKLSNEQKFRLNLSEHLRDCKRVLNDRGSFFLNLGDTFYNGNLQNVPHRVVLKLQEQGWILRNTIIWSKTNPKPSSSNL